MIYFQQLSFKIILFPNTKIFIFIKKNKHSQGSTGLFSYFLLYCKCKHQSSPFKKNSGNLFEGVLFSSRVAYPNFGHPAQTSVFTFQVIILIFADESSFATIVNGLSILKLFHLMNGDFFSWHTYTASTKCATQNSKVWAGFPKLGHTTLS